MLTACLCYAHATIEHATIESFLNWTNYCRKGTRDFGVINSSISKNDNNMKSVTKLMWYIATLYHRKLELEKLRGWCQSGTLGRAKPLRGARFMRCTCFSLQKKKKKKKKIDLQIFRWIGKVIKNTLNSKYYREHQRTSNVLVMFKHFMTSRLI